MTDHPVNTYSDLVAAINAANASADDDTITFAADITITSAEVATYRNLPTLGVRGAQGNVIASGSLTIEGGGHTLDGSNQYRLLFANAGTITVNNLNLVGGLAQGGAGGTGLNGESGGAGWALGARSSFAPVRTSRSRTWVFRGAPQ